MIFCRPPPCKTTTLKFQDPTPLNQQYFSLILINLYLGPVLDIAVGPQQSPQDYFSLAQLSAKLHYKFLQEFSMQELLYIHFSPYFVSKLTKPPKRSYKLVAKHGQVCKLQLCSKKLPSLSPTLAWFAGTCQGAARRTGTYNNAICERSFLGTPTFFIKRVVVRIKHPRRHNSDDSRDGSAQRSTVGKIVTKETRCVKGRP